MKTNPLTDMNFDKPFSRYTLLAAFAIVIVAGSAVVIDENLPRARVAGDHSSGVASFAPADDLEVPDLRLLSDARSTIDVAMYAFTDEKIASALRDAAKRGVRIRIYRDQVQFAAEEARAAERGQSSTMDMLRGVQGIEIRIKGGGQSMHLKAYCIDGSSLRTGSANWSQQGEITQDNDLYVISEEATVQKFEDDFESMWHRSNNRPY